ncbi:MAG: 30S ribosomal protein S1 [Actinobacteria bacterium]|nr:30S ribosomal protein S1 [Actinomycetota bacterium]MBU4219007.1 30S ribosomal protein S1 [Actinomycetota bacterium]MBU4359195.1 30S ribosomal protein S1 [Actinomycetota bacterium]MBU4391510.1 30S ribosomal protein S1 [Actinomycetota bacterium]MBU4403650.1 30S ribosomal protein S1 [Actinomycetota bacterium]
MEDETGTEEYVGQVEEDEEDPLTGKGARESLAGLGLDPEESQIVPDYDGTMKMFNEGDIVSGLVVKVDKEEVLLDIGYKSEGVIPARELSIRYDAKTSDIVSPGDRLEALVLQKEDKEGRLILSKKRAQYERAWNNIESVKDEGGVVDGEVIEVVKGGLILDIGLRGFLPASLVDLRRVKDLNQFIGQTLEAKVIELDKNRNNVVLSRRAHLEVQKSTERKEFLEQLEKGTKHKGSVSSIVNFGAFVDLGGVDGLIHISELSWSHVDHPSEVLAAGDEVDVEILDVDLERERVSLSLKKAQEDPWQKLSKEKPAGSTVQGKVTKLVPFGAFVEIAPGVEGLVHISELAWEHIEFPEEVLSVGDEIEAKIIDIDLSRRRISLSVKQLTGPGEAAGYQEYQAEPEHEPDIEPDIEPDSEPEPGPEPELVEAEEFEERLSGKAPEEEADKKPALTEIVSDAAEILAEVERIESQVASPEYEEATEAEKEEPPAAPAPETVEEAAEVVSGEETPVEEEKQEEAEETPAEEGTTESPEIGEEETPEKPVAEDGSLESVLADMKKKGSQP